MGRDGDDRTLFCANLSENVTEALLYELFNQAGPLDRVHIPRKDNRQCSFAFVTYVHQCSVPYAIDVYAGTRLFDRDLRITVQNAGNNAISGGSSTQAVAAPKTYGLDAMGPLAGGSLRAGGFGNTTIMAPSVAPSFADDMQPRSRGGRHSGGGGGGVGVSGVSGDSGLTQTEIEIQRLLLMSAQMMGAPGSMQPANGGGGGGGGGRGDYGGQQQNYQPPGHHHRHHGQHRRFDDSPPSFRNAPYRSEHDNRFDQRDHHHQPRDHHRDHQRGGDRQRDRSSHGNSNRSSSSRQQKPDNRRWQNR